MFFSVSHLLLCLLDGELVVLQPLHRCSSKFSCFTTDCCHVVMPVKSPDFTKFFRNCDIIFNSVQESSDSVKVRGAALQDPHRRWSASEPTWRRSPRTGLGRASAPPTALSLGSPTSPPPPSTKGSLIVTLPGEHLHSTSAFPFCK